MRATTQLRNILSELLKGHHIGTVQSQTSPRYGSSLQCNQPDTGGEFIAGGRSQQVYIVENLDPQGLQGLQEEARLLEGEPQLQLRESALPPDFATDKFDRSAGLAARRMARFL